MLRKIVGDIMENKKINYDTDFGYLEEFWQKGGTYVIPAEIINQLTGQIEDLVEKCKEYKELCRAKSESIDKYDLKVSFLEIEKKKLKEKIEQFEQNKKDAIDILNRKVK